MKTYYQSNPNDHLERSISALRAVGSLVSNANIKHDASDVVVDPCGLHNLLQILEEELSEAHQNLTALNAA